MPNAVLKASTISNGAKVAFAVLLSYARQKEFCFPSQERLSKDLNCSVRKVQRLLRELKSAGLIDWKQRGLTHPNIYYILPTSRWSGPKSPKRKDTTDLSHPDTTDSAHQEAPDSSFQERTPPSPKGYSGKKIQSNVNVTERPSFKRMSAHPGISETALTKFYGLNSAQITTVRRLVDEQADVLGDRDRNHAAYVKRAAEAVRDGFAPILESALGDVKDANHRKVIASLPAYFTRVYDAMRANANSPRLDFSETRPRRAERRDEPASTGEVPVGQRERLLARIAAEGLTIPTRLREASLRDIAAWYDEAQEPSPLSAGERQ